jgi:chromosome partitioning protein
MLVVALISTKGGCGKSTLAECLAVEAARLGRSVFLADLDPQQSTAEWWRRRGGPENPMMLASRGSMIRALRDIREHRSERDVMVIDTPGSDMAVVSEAIHAADCVVVVVQASIKDLEAQGAARDLIERAGKADRTVYVINRADRRSSLVKHAADLLRSRSAVEPLIVAERSDYVRADAAGKAGNEISAKARAEISALWAALEEVGDERRDEKPV